MVDKFDRRTKEYKELVKKAETATIAPPVEVETTSKATSSLPEEPKAPAKSCPWCVFNHRPGTRLLLSNKWQCQDCGKMWREEALGKPYSLQLEQGLI